MRSQNPRSPSWPCQGLRREGPMNLEQTPDERPEDPPRDGSAHWLRAGLVTLDQARVLGRLLETAEPDPTSLRHLADAGVITRSQAAALARLHSGRDRPPSGGGWPPNGAAHRGTGSASTLLKRPDLEAGRLGVLVASL